MKKLFLLLVTVLTVTLCASAQTRTVTGTVLEEGSEEPIIGASVTAGNATMGVSTDLDGKFAIQVPANVSTIKVSHVGMQTKTVKITGSPLKIYLSSTAENLNTVIVTAYGTTTKGAYTGSAGVVNAAQLENVQVSNVTNALSGKIAGVQTFSSNGQPGTGSSIRIRGVGSINANQEPLYVVDGMPFDGDISSIPTQDIESITVQKDAASTALYGARGANGVVQITTKRGSEGSATITLDMKWGSNSRAIPNYDVITDQRQYLETVYQTLKGTAKYHRPGVDPHVWANQNLWSSLGYQTWTVPEGQDAVGRNGKFNPNATPGYTLGNYYFLGDDWSKNTLINGLRQEYNMSVTGGTERLKYYVSGSYLGDEGIIKNSHYNRFSTRASVDYQAKSWLKIGTNLAYTYQNSAYPGDQTLDAASSTGNAFNIANNLAPIYPFYIRLAETKGIAYNSTYGKPIYDYGEGEDYGWGPTGMSRNVYGQSNPVGALTYDTSDNLSDIFDGKWYATLTPFKGFSLTGNAGYYIDNTRGHFIQNGVYGQFKGAGGFVQQEYSRARSINLQLLAQYDFTVAQRNNFGIMFGFENSAFRNEVLYGSGGNLYNPSWPFLDNIIDNKQNGGYEYSLVHRGFFGRLRYDFDGKYYFTASLRRDGSSRFAKNHRWGTFWSASAGWDMSKEAFLQPYSDVIDILKLKFSYGQNGNDGIGARYIAYADQYQISGGDGVWSDGALNYKGNKDITWEKSDAINTGVDFSFKKGMISGSIEYYQRTVSDMLFNLPVAPSLGYSTMPYNVGKMRNNGFEIDLNYRPVATKDITLDINANLTMGWNKVLKLEPSIMNQHANWRNDSKLGWLTGSRIFFEGESMYNLWLVEYAGVNENGQATWMASRDITFDTPGEGREPYAVNEKGEVIAWGIPYSWKHDENGSGKMVVDQWEQEEYATDNYQTARNTNRKATGNIMPKGYGGFGFDLQAYGFDLSLGFGYQFGGKILDYGYQNMTGSYSMSNLGTNFHKDLLNAWTEENHTNIPRLDGEESSAASATSTRYLISSNYLSLNNVTFGYTLPKRLVSKMHLGSVRVYFAAENVALWSKRQGLDPRQGFVSSENSTYSPIRSLSGGIKVSF
ncbi:MAG: SusC/RagA family TonB-linked outer membrane protein [Muribaculaceae bacterium]